MQIDVLKIQGYVVLCNLYTNERCVKIAMALDDYNALTRDGFFIRDGSSADSAGVLNTTLAYDQKNSVNPAEEVIPASYI